MTQPARNQHRPPHTCSGCTRYWTGLSMCHCSVCHNTFGGTRGFDRHRKGGECRHPQELNYIYNEHRAVWTDPTRADRFAHIVGDYDDDPEPT